MMAISIGATYLLNQVNVLIHDVRVVHRCVVLGSWSSLTITNHFLWIYVATYMDDIITGKESIIPLFFKRIFDGV